MGAPERGSVMPLVGAVFAVSVLLTLAVADLGRAAVDKARAQAAADAAALAGVVEGQEGAEALAAANGGVVVSFHRDGSTVIVVVEVGAARARAAAGYSD
ncbi:MAG: pilus assembly protein TadG-related protein [Actinomycetota bacterium]